MVGLIAATCGGFITGWACRGWVLKRRLRNPPSIGVPWEEGHTQRGNGSGGPSTPKSSIKPQPSGGHLIREGQLWGIYQPRPQSGTPSAPPEAP